jgi:hypothetical protein
MFKRSLLYSFLVLAVVVVLGPVAAAGTQTSSSACLAFPTPTAQQWTELFPNVNTDLCETACTKWQMTCINMARASFRCFQALFQSLTVLDFVECSELTGPEKAGCNASVKENQRGLLGELQGDLQNAVGICQGSLSDCINDCLD